MPTQAERPSYPTPLPPEEFSVIRRRKGYIVQLMGSRVMRKTYKM